jgi:BASS family bile acid:Na+ symporter
VKSLLPIAVLLMMISIGMTLQPGEVLRNWRRTTAGAWLRLLIATFLIPPLIVLLLARVLPIEPSALVGLFMVSVAPGAPLLTRNIAKRGFDMHLAASYQVWGAVLTPIMLPLTVAAAGKLYNHSIWISPLLLLREIAEKQFVPLLAGIALMYALPAIGRRLQPVFNAFGNATLAFVIVVFLIKMWPELRQMSGWVFVVAVALGLGSLAAVMLLLSDRPREAATLALSNTNRHVGLALLLSGQYLHNRFALPSVASYALLAPLLMFLFSMWAHKHIITDTPAFTQKAA